MEFRITPYKAPPAVVFNYDEIKAALEEKLVQYKGLVVTDDSVAAAKADRADLNNKAKMLNDRRIEIEREYMKPFTSFKKQVDELVGMIKAVSTEIDVQVKGIEEKEKADKAREIRAIYAETITDLAALLPFEKIFDERWLNKTFTLDKVRSEFVRINTKTVGDLTVIAGLESDYKQEIKDKYADTLDISLAIDEGRRLKVLRASMEAAKQAVVQKEQAAAVVPQPKQEEAIGQTEKLSAFSLRVFVNATQRDALRAFLQANGIKYETIKVK